MSPGLGDAADPSVVERQAALYERQWSERSGGAYSPDLLRYRVFGAFLRGRVLDIGAGDGLLARSFPDRDVWSVDLTSAGLRRVAGRAVVACAVAPVPMAATSTAVTGRAAPASTAMGLLRDMTTPSVGRWGAPLGSRPTLRRSSHRRRLIHLRPGAITS